MKKLLSVILISLPLLAVSQSQTYTGEVKDPNGNPLLYATVALLKPVDSTLQHFAITNAEGKFQLNKIPAGDFVMQIAFMGYQTYSKAIKLSSQTGPNLGVLTLQPTPINLGEVQVTGERVPLIMKKDTIEFNAAAFKTNPDAVAEDLLKKLPGVEVDRSGNIKAMGENVTKVLVDGKEFFSNDPKVATKNLPAESINKVQVFNKKSDEAELLGIDDSEYEKTINIVLKPDMKKAVFGDVRGGGGLPEYYLGNGKVYRFTEKQQLAALGQLNNVNRIGFSFRDYIDFNGGIRNVMGDRGSLDDMSVPVDFGRPVNGKVTAGALGVNYSYEIVKDNRINVSYMGNGTDNAIEQTTYTRNFTPTRNFEQNSNENGSGENRNHLFNLGWRNKSNPKQHFMLNGIATITNSNSISAAITETLLSNVMVNQLNNMTTSDSKQMNTSLDGSLLIRGNENWRMLKLSGNVRYNQSLRENDWNNITKVFNNPLITVPIIENQFSDNDSKLMQGTFTVTGLRRMSTTLYLEPTLRSGLTSDVLDRQQGFQIDVPTIVIDSLSPRIEREYQWIRPRLLLKKFSKKTRFTVGLEYEIGRQMNTLRDNSQVSLNTSRLLPQAMWEYEYATGKRVSARYFTSTNLPGTLQLLPIISTSNPLALSYGNRNLKPEYSHRANLSWVYFDQFSFTSLFTNISASYTKNKINRSITVGDNLKQVIRLVNVPEDYTASMFSNFSTPIRPLGINISLGLNESWNRGMSYVNSIANINTNLSHSLQLRFDNRKKDKVDVEIGGRISYTDAKYSIQSQLNRSYFSYSTFGDFRYTPSTKLNMRISADLTKYNDQSFNASLTVPLISGEISYSFLANNRAVITLEGYDLLNKNTGITRSSELNYLREVRSSTIGRYILLSFKYRLNKFGVERTGGPDRVIEIRGR